MPLPLLGGQPLFPDPTGSQPWTVFTTMLRIGSVLYGSGHVLPAFLFVGLLTKVTDRLRASAWTSPRLDGVDATAQALMAGVSYQLAMTAIVDPLTTATTVATLVLL